MNILNTEQDVLKHLDQTIRRLAIPKGISCFLAGGSLLALFREKIFEVKDFDVFANSEVDYHKLLCYFMGKFRKSVETDNAVTFDMGHAYSFTRCLQLIKKRVGSTLDVINSFDLTVCSVAYEFHTNRFRYHNTWHKDVRENKLRLGSNDIMNVSLYRIDKYEGKGFDLTFNIEEVCDRCEQRLSCLTSGEKICRTPTES
jgi:hypothetical protein